MEQAAAKEALAGSVRRALETGAFWLLIATLAWAPFPLGSNRPWSWSLLVLLTGACWTLWAASAALAPRPPAQALRRVAVPVLLAGAALLWGLMQSLPILPGSWAHPIWEMAGQALSRDLAATVSLDPWRTATELMKLLSYAMTAWLAYAMTRSPERAALLLDSLIAIATVYALYSLIIAFADWPQFELFYAAEAPSRGVSGPFVSRNTLASYAGLGVLCAAVRMFALGGATVVAERGFRTLAASTFAFVYGRGAVSVFAMLMAFSLLLATASRAGFAAMLAGLCAVLLLAGVFVTRGARKGWPLTGTLLLIGIAVLLFQLNGADLQERLAVVLADGYRDEVRAALWSAAWRMIGDSPWLGFGLGSFEAAYPLYAEQVLPFTMDKAHNDYLELAAGWGLPAALTWWLAIAWLAGICVRGVAIRRRHRAYPLIAAGATALVG